MPWGGETRRLSVTEAMPTISTTARRLRAYQATLDRLARPARPTTASRRCAPAGDGTLHALLTVSAYFTLAYIYVVIGSIDLLTSIVAAVKEMSAVHRGSKDEPGAI